MYHQWKSRKVRRAKVWKIINKNSIATRAKQRKCVNFIERTWYGMKFRTKFAKQLRCTYEKAWDIENGRMFWLNHETKAASWERPRLLWRYGDVEMPTPWVAIPEGLPGDPADEEAEAAAAVQTTKKLNFWHVTAKRSLPRKPDGLLLCQRCEINLALRRCFQCETLFCFICHRETHSHPMGFLQNTAPDEEQLHDQTFLDRLQKHVHHQWGPVEPVKCDMCNSVTNGGLLAAFCCQDCGNKNMCRPCYRRYEPSPPLRCTHSLIRFIEFMSINLSRIMFHG